MDYLSLCLIVKNENGYLSEWVDYYRLIGVERFYIYDNGSQVSVRETLRDDISKNIVKVIDINGNAQQLAAYDHCIKNFGQYSHWIGFIDTDEFIVPHTTADLREFLVDYEPYGGLAVNWLVFGSNGHNEKPTGGMIANYSRRTIPALLENRAIKSIVHPDQVHVPLSPHHFIHKRGSWTVNEMGERVDNQYFPPSVNRIHINHYWCRSKNEYMAKLSRGRGDGGAAYDHKRFDYTELQSIIEDRTIFSILNNKGILTEEETDRLMNDPQAAPKIDLPTRLHSAVNARELPIGSTEVPDIREVEAPSEEILEIKRVDALIAAAMEGKQKDKLEQYYRHMISLYPETLIFKLDLADLFLSMDDPGRCWELLALCWKMAPKTYEVLMHMGKYFSALKRMDEAEKVYRLGLEFDPNGFKTLCLLAAAMSDNGKIDEAFGLISHAVDEFPYSQTDEDILTAVKKLGVYFYEHGDWRRAQKMYLSALEYNPNDPVLLINLGKIYFDQKYFSAAKTYLEKALAVSPDDEEAQAGYRMVEKALSRVIPPTPSS